MVNLKCSACNCIHNQDHYCCRGNILVDGEPAKEATATCCSSFYSNKDGASRNSYEAPDANIIVDCEAIHCIYNEGRMCCAEKIGISGANADNPDQTLCSTFKLR